MGSYASGYYQRHFGLVHFFWVPSFLPAYGYWRMGLMGMCIENQNTFYAALLHALVNSSPIIFGKIVLCKMVYRYGAHPNIPEYRPAGNWAPANSI